MTPQEEKLIREWNDEISRDIQISLLITDDKRTKEFREFCESLERLAPKSRIIKEKGQPKEPPAIQIGSTLRYHAVPLGAELKPFLQTLSLSPDKLAAIPASLHEHLKKLKLPATLKLFIAQQCPVCPTVVPQITGLAKANELISVTVIDCTLFPEMAQSDRVQSVPTVVLGEHFRWTGLVQLEELVEVIINRDPAALPVSSLERMLEEGSALQV
ncbi:MAG: thioredoxin family protein, partial [Pseudomonadota bacterium]